MSRASEHPRRAHANAHASVGTPVIAARARSLLLIALALAVTSCAGAGGVETGRPRPSDVPYPAVIGSSDERRAKALAAWNALATAQGATAPLVSVPEIDPATGSLRALPANASVALRIPFVGAPGKTEMTEDEERESLRRFIAEHSALLGVEPADLSLVEHARPDSGPRVARYRQSPFDFPLRGDYGRLEIAYDTERRVVSLTNTSLPDSPQLERALSGARTLKADEVVRTLVGRNVAFTGRDGRQQTRAVTSADEISLREIVVYPVRNEAGAPLLALHLAWEVVVWQDAPVHLYLDAVTGAQLAAAPADPS